MFDTASPLEILWILIGLALAGVCFWGILLASEDVRLVLRRRGTTRDLPALLLIARQNRRNAAIRLVKQILFIGLAVVYGFVPAPMVNEMPGEAWATVVVLLAAQTLLAYATLADRADNIRLKQYETKRLQERRAAAEMREPDASDQAGH